MSDKPVGGYIAYLNLDFLDMVFSEHCLQGDPEKQQEYIEDMQDRLADVVLKRQDRPSMMLSYSWYDKDGRLRRAVELMPVAASAKGLQIVTPDVTGYQELRDKLKALELECAIQKRQINMLAEVLKTNNLISDLVPKKEKEDRAI